MSVKQASLWTSFQLYLSKYLRYVNSVEVSDVQMYTLDHIKSDVPGETCTFSLFHKSGVQLICKILDISVCVSVTKYYEHLWQINDCQEYGDISNFSIKKVECIFLPRGAPKCYLKRRKFTPCSVTKILTNSRCL